jgi:hypothetical protein
MTRRTIQELIAQCNASLPDNTSEAISPADVRNMLIDTFDTITPMYGGLGVTSQSYDLTTTPQVITFTTALSSFPPEWTVDPATGTLSRSLGAVGAMTSKLWVTGIAEGPQGAEIIIKLQKNGVDMGRQTEETMEGPAKSVGFALNCIDYGTVNVTYRLMISVSSGTATVSMREMQFLGENVMVRDISPIALGGIA